MSDEHGSGNGSGNGSGSDIDAQVLLAKLMETGFFQQFTTLEQSLHTIATDLQSLGSAATQRTQETESLAVHVLATEAVLVAMLKKYPVAADEVMAVASAVTGDQGSDQGNPAVLAIVEELIGRAG